jgi:L,D-peptidoglycan transpeptidase YkuD (ErfK/YbiS/YcfS/YnhG family)
MLMEPDASITPRRQQLVEAQIGRVGTYPAARRSYRAQPQMTSVSAGSAFPMWPHSSGAA